MSSLSPPNLHMSNAKTQWAHRKTRYHFNMLDLRETLRTLRRCHHFRHRNCTCQMQNTMGTPQNMVSLQHAGFARSIALNHDNSSTDNSSSDNSSSDNSSSDNSSRSSRPEVTAQAVLASSPILDTVPINFCKPDRLKSGTQ